MTSHLFWAILFLCEESDHHELYGEDGPRDKSVIYN